MHDEINMKDKELWNKVMGNIADDSLTLSTYFTFQIKGDIRHLLFTFSRYKFAARILGDKPAMEVLELGCNEGLGTLLLAQVASRTLGVDFDKRAIDWAKQNLSRSGLEFVAADILGSKFGSFDAVVSLDVIEHISREKEELFLQTIVDNLNEDGFALIGTPNITADAYASEASRMGHINLYDHQRLKELFLKEFHNVFLFGMNDEVVHTGFLPMCHYLFVLACNKRRHSGE
ncbi:MAG: class I SAM-dependent methyltransferase [Syntrophomonadaceae bacterium]|nr:class I SAM-dependent methyltransferase [Syntrophomonadaceae bacterium]